MSVKEETNIQNRIRAALSERGCKVFRCTVGNFYTKWGQEIKVGTKGHSDLYGVKPGGRAFFLEVKTPIRRSSKRTITIHKSNERRCGSFSWFCPFA